MESIAWQQLADLGIILQSELRTVLEAAAKAAEKALPKGVKTVFDITNPKAVDWIRAHAAELVKLNIMPESQQAIREIIERGFLEGIPPAKMARMIREQIGILPKHQIAVDKYRKWLIDVKGRTVADADRLAATYAKKLIRYRATVIARNETMVASKQGQSFLWQQAIDEGEITEADWDRIWIVTPDDRLCRLCAPMDKVRADMNGLFISPDPRYPWSGRMEHRHVQCRCAEALIRKGRED